MKELLDQWELSKQSCKTPYPNIVDLIVTEIEVSDVHYSNIREISSTPVGWKLFVTLLQMGIYKKDHTSGIDKIFNN
jgi:hypothetical protein